MKVKLLVFLAALIPFCAHADFWQIGSGIAQDGSITASEAQAYFAHALGNYSGNRRSFDAGRSIGDVFGPPMIPTTMQITMTGAKPVITLSAQENCEQIIGDLKQMSEFSYLLQPNTATVKALFALESRNCPGFAKQPYAMLEFDFDKATGALTRMILDTEPGPSYEGGREELFR